MDALKTTTPQETKLHFLDYWRIIRIRKTVILAVFLLGEPIGANLIAGIAAVFAGIWVASTEGRRQAQAVLPRQT